MLAIREAWLLLKKSVQAWNDDYAASMGAALAYYTAFSLAPLLIIVTAIAGLAFGREAAQGQIVSELSGLVGTVLFAAAYRILPRAKIAWSDVWIGATVTALLFTLGKYLIGLYLGRVGVASGFGAAGSLVIVLVWVYYSAQLFLLGAEFTWLYAYTLGSRAGDGLPPVRRIGSAA